ncbi:MAG: DUF1211 domain-containing protein [Sphingobacteriaceae bacterium]|nr:DUF1211 domain-containing protein [Cytophagaceae bacterium]
MQGTEPENHNRAEERNRFQVERLILFTDAVFAIAITLLIIEIKVPHLKRPFSDDALSHALLHQVPEWVGFVISFGVIGIYWYAHHRMFGFVEQYDGKLIFRNFVFLMSIVVMPFTSALYSHYFEKNPAFQVYCFNVATTGLLQLWLWAHISNPRAPIGGGITRAQRTYNYWRGAIVPVVFLMAALLAYVSPIASRAAFFLIFIAQGGLSASYRKRPGFF